MAKFLLSMQLSLLDSVTLEKIGETLIISVTFQLYW